MLKEPTSGAGRVAPHDVEAEQALLGCFLIDASETGDVIENFSPDYFFVVRNRWVFEAVAAAYGRGGVDVITVEAELKRKGRDLENCGMSYLVSLMTATESTSNAPAYAALIKEKWQRRKLLESAAELARLAYDEELTVESIVSDHVKAVEGQAEGDERIALQADVFARYYEADSARLTSTELPPDRVPTGYPIFSKRMGGGFPRKMLTVVHGLPGMGKTSWLAQGSLQVAKAGFKVGVFPLEENDQDWLANAMHAELGIDPYLRQSDSRNTREADADSALQKMVHASDWAAHLPIAYSQSGHLSVPELKKECRRMAKELDGLDIIYIDNLNFLGADPRYKNESFAIAQVCAGFQDVAKEMNCAVILIAHDNKQGMMSGKEPQPQDLYMSQGVFQQARVLLCVHPDEGHDDYRAAQSALANDGKTWVSLPYNVHIQKNNKGAKGIRPFWFTPAHQRFVEREV